MNDCSQAMLVSDVTHRLSEYMAAAARHELPASVVEKAKHHIIDTLAAMVSGAPLPAGVKAIDFARGYGGRRVCTVAGSSVQCGPIEAALANGMLAHADETDDSHAPSLSHPGCAVVPAALAAAELFDVSGDRFLRAVALGYDVGPRVTMTLGVREFFRVGHKSTHSVAGVFGAASAAASVAGLTAQQCRWVLDYAAQQSSGISSWQRDPDHIEKAFVFGGMPARSGMTAAYLVAAGFTAVDDVFGGPDNFFAAFAPQADPHGLIDGLGERYELLRSNIKKWSVGSPIQAPLDAIATIRERTSFEEADVRKVIVHVGDLEARVVNNRSMPDVCLQHMVAVMLHDGTVSFKTAHDKERMSDPEIQELRAGVELIEDEELGRRLPNREAVVRIELRDGRTLEEHVKAVRGTPANAMTAAEVNAKCADLLAPVVGPNRSAELIEAVQSLERAKSMKHVATLLRAL